jgi:hypothetical protein
MNSYPGLLRIDDHVVYDVMGKQRYGVVQQFRYDEGRRGPTSAAVHRGPLRDAAVTDTG